MRAIFSKTALGLTSFWIVGGRKDQTKYQITLSTSNLAKRTLWIGSTRSPFLGVFDLFKLKDLHLQQQRLNGTGNLACSISICTRRAW
jgi:hypothetical protein